MCNRKHPWGWKCITAPHLNHNEPCGLVPRWYNWTEFARLYRRSTR